LFTIIGGIIPVHNRRIIKKLKNSFLKFAAKENINIFFIETNAREVLNEALLFGKFGKYINHSSWWEGVNHGLVQLSLCAPLTVREIGLLKIASSATNVNRFPYGSDPRLDSKISWGDIKISHEGVEFTRQEKIKFLLKRFIDVNNYYPKLQVCNYAPFISEQFNCGYCEKCSRTIIGLLLENIDPTKCGFPILDDFFEHVKKDVVPNALIKDWKRIQDKIHNGTKCYIHNSKNFFDWLKNYDFSNNVPKSTSTLNLKSSFYHIFSKIPRKIQTAIIKLYYNRKYLSHSLARRKVLASRGF